MEKQTDGVLEQVFGGPRGVDVARRELTEQAIKNVEAFFRRYAKGETPVDPKNLEGPIRLYLSVMSEPVTFKEVLAACVRHLTGSPYLTGEALTLAWQIDMDVRDAVWALQRDGVVEFDPNRLVSLRRVEDPAPVV